jgi:recombination protein RecT
MNLQLSCNVTRADLLYKWGKEKNDMTKENVTPATKYQIDALIELCISLGLNEPAILLKLASDELTKVATAAMKNRSPYFALVLSTSAIIQNVLFTARTTTTQPLTTKNAPDSTQSAWERNMANEITTTNNQQPIEKISTYLYKDEVIKRFSDMLGEKQAQRFVASVLTAVMADPKLQACTAQSVYLSAVRSATLGLSVDPAYGQAYLVAYGNVCTFMPGYKGFRDKASENGIGSHVIEVYDNEKIETNIMTGEVRINGGNGFWRTIEQDQGSNGHKITGYLASWWDVKNPNSGEKHFLYMTIAEIEEYAETYAPAYKYKDSPWNKNKLSRKEMFKKTVIKRLLRKTAPLNPVVSRLLVQFEDEQTEEKNLNFDGVEIKGTEEVEPKQRKSELELMSELGYDNPDPIKEKTWKEWIALEARASKQGIGTAVIEKAKFTETDLQEYIKEITPYVVDAERQAAE